MGLERGFAHCTGSELLSMLLSYKKTCIMCVQVQELPFLLSTGEVKKPCRNVVPNASFGEGDGFSLSSNSVPHRMHGHSDSI